MAELDEDESDLNNVEVCICDVAESLSITDSQITALKSLLPEYFHHILCSYTCLDSHVDKQENSYASGAQQVSSTADRGATVSNEAVAAGVVHVVHDGDTTIDNSQDEQSCAGSTFKARLRVNVETLQELELWKKEFAERSKTTMRYANISVCAGKKTLYKTRLRCQHNTLPRSQSADKRKSSKNTRCPAVMSLTLKRSEIMRKLKDREVRRAHRSHDIHMPEYPLIVAIEFMHNHPLDTASVLRRRDVAPYIVSKFKSLLTVGYGPLAVLGLHKYDLFLEHGVDKYLTYVNDRHHFPDVSWCYRLCYKLLKKKCRSSQAGEVSAEEIKEHVLLCCARLRALVRGGVESTCQVPAMEPDAVNDAGSRVTSVPLFVLNSQDVEPSLRSVSEDEDFVTVETMDNFDFAIAICTPLMKRVHRLVQQSGEVVFVDAGPPMDKRRHCRVIVLMARSCAGGLPLGVLAATSDIAVKRAFQLYTGLLDYRCFFGRGTAGPQLFIVDDWAPLQTALCETFKGSVSLLCGYRLLTNYWRHLWDRKSPIPVGDRCRLFNAFRSAICSATVDRQQARLMEVRSELSVSNFPATQAFVNCIQERRSEWAACCQSRDWAASNIVSSLGGTRGLCDCAARVLKDIVVHRVMSMTTLPTLLDFVGSRFDQYYERRLIDIVCDQLSNATALRFMQDEDADAEVAFSTSTQFTVICATSSQDGALQCEAGGAASMSDCASLDVADVLMPPTDIAIPNGRSAPIALPSMCPAKCSVFCVEMNSGVCSCDIGITGAPCRHQWAVVHRCEPRAWIFNAIPSIDAKRLFAHVATGQGTPELVWFAACHPLQSIADDVAEDDDSDMEGGIETINFNGSCIGAEETVDAIAHLAAAAQFSAIAPDAAAPPEIEEDGVSATNSKRVFINWNGMSYEFSIPEQDSVPTEPVLQQAVGTASTSVLPPPSRDRLHQALTKIEDAYAAHPVALETAVGAFCDNVESIDILEALNAALLSFGNGFVTSAAAGMPYSWS